MIDLLIKNGKTVNGIIIDIAIKNGTILEVGQNIISDAKETLDLSEELYV